VRATTRREYRRLLVNFALTYFDRQVRVRDLDRARRPCAIRITVATGP
jgi:hypothetical protein